ncbi:hypothetical protein AAG570_008235 [Ranatra chinensis]|uniref:Uncharacterized protein n=1 Tax=Ranatra chinensis TaxID=642074 RepID=A0ABD0Y7X1_9HEMI
MNSIVSADNQIGPNGQLKIPVGGEVGTSINSKGPIYCSVGSMRSGRILSHCHLAPTVTPCEKKNHECGVHSLDPTKIEEYNNRTKPTVHYVAETTVTYSGLACGRDKAPRTTDMASFSLDIGWEVPEGPSRIQKLRVPGLEDPKIRHRPANAINARGGPTREPGGHWAFRGPFHKWSDSAYDRKLVATSGCCAGRYPQRPKKCNRALIKGSEAAKATFTEPHRIRLLNYINQLPHHGQGTRISKAERSKHVHLDIVGPLPPSQVKPYCLAMIDRGTTKSITRAFYEHWISPFGVPLRITTC